ncbi:hypothetical protein KSP39_PZI004942 [Platanthera zijinensis]|uniref:Uncharacterized protein n=1 Tax=Platanthera zijinensis TaxID=2320716 RepID=A0AAP0BRS1_9ASPA
MHVLNAFDGVKGSWFVCIDAVPMRPAFAKYQKALGNMITHEHTEHRDFAVTVCDMHNKHQETAFRPLSPKNQDSLIKDRDFSMVIPGKSVEPENQKSLDASVKEFLADDCPSLQIKKSTPAQRLQVCSTAVLIPGDGNFKALNGLKVNEVYLQESVAVSQSEPEKNSGPDGEGSSIPIVTSIDCVHRPDMLINQEKDDRRKKEPKNLDIEAREFMPSTRIHKTRSKKMDTKCKDGLHEEHLEDNDDSSRSANLPAEISCNEKMEIQAVSSDGLPSKIPHENTAPLKNPPVEKHTKKRRRKSTKSHEGAHLAMPNDNRDMRITSDTPNLANKKEIEQSMETCLNIETKEVQTLQANSIDLTKNHVNLGEEVNLGIIFKGHGGEARISSQKSPTMLSHNTGIVKGQSSKILPHKETNSHQNMEFDGLKCITELNVREVEAGSIDAKEGIPMSPEVFAYKEQISNVVSKDSLIDKCHDSGKEIEAAANPNGANEEIFLAQVDSNVLNTSKRRRKKSKIESSRVLQSPVVNVNDVPVNFNGAQVLLTDIQNESNATLFIKQADQKVNGGHNLDTMIELSTSSQKLPNQEQAPHMNSVNPPISMPHNLSKKSSESVKKTVGIIAPSQPAQAKEHRSRKKTKGEQSKIYSLEISEVMLPKFNGNVAESNDGRGSTASKLDNTFNHRIEQRCIDSMATVPLYHEDFPTIVTVQQVNPLDSSSCKPKDLSGQTNAKAVTKQSNLIQCRDLATPTKSKRDRRKYRKEVLEAQVSSEMTEHLVVAESNDGSSDPSKLDNMLNQKIQQHCTDANVTVPLSHEDFPTLVKVLPVNPLYSSSCKPHDLSAQTNSKVVTKQSDVTQPGDLASPTKSKRIRKKSKTEVLEAQISSEMCEHLVVAESNEGRSDPSKLDNMFNQKMEQHCVDGRVTVPLSHEDFSTLDKVLRWNLLDSSSCKPQDLSGQTNAKILTKQNDVTKNGDFADPIKSKRERKKSKKEVLEARVSSEKSEHLELHREFVDNFVPKEGKRCPDVHATSVPSGKSETRRKHKNSRKTDLNQPYQDSPTNLVQSSSHKQHEVTGQIQVNDISDCNAVGASQDDADKDSKIGNIHKAIKTKQSSMLKLSLGIVESDSSLHKVHDNQKHDNKIQDSGSQSHVQILKSGEFQSKQEKRITADWKGKSQSLIPDHGIDNMVSKDCDVQHKDLFRSTARNPVGYSVGLSNFDFFPSDDMDNAEASGDSTEENPDMRYRVRKLQRGSSKKTINSNLEKLASPRRRFSDASGSSSDSRSGSYGNKDTIKTGLDRLSTFEDLDSHLKEVKTKAYALKLQTDAGSLDTRANKSGEDGKDVGSKAIEDQSRSAATTQKVLLSTILKSSSSYKKARLTASQSEFVDHTESQQPLESQQEPEP